LAIILAVCSPLAAQDPFGPFGGAKPASPPGGAPPDPFGAAKVQAQPKAAVAKPVEDALPSIKDEKDPVVLAIRESDPTTPDELMFAVRTLFDVGRPQEAKFYARKLLAANPDQKTLLGFHRDLGSAFFFRISRDERMRPEGERLGKAVQTAAYQASRDPARVRSLVKQLSDPSPSLQRRAIDGLREAGTATVTPILEALADPNRADEHPQVRAVLPEIGEVMIDPMLAALETRDEGLRVQVMQVLGEFKTPRAIPFLVGPYLRDDSPAALRQTAGRALMRIVGKVPTRYDVEQYLYHRAKAYYEGAPAGRLDYEDQIEMWAWDGDQKTCVPRRYPADDASLMMAARLAAELYNVSPDNVDFRRLFLLTNLDFAKTEAGLDRPLPKGKGTASQVASAAGASTVEDLLAYAIEHDHVVTAIAAAEILFDVGDETLLDSDDGRPRPLALALRHGDRRLRMAAAETIMRIDPKRPYAGSSYLTEALGYAIRTVGSRRALIAHPRVEKSQTLVGMLDQIGYQADAARSGRETFLLAAKNPDYELLLISDGISYPDANETIQMLRRDPRTSRLVIGLMAREHNVERAKQSAEVDPLLESFPRPHNTEMMAYQVARMLKLAGRDLVSFDERIAQASSALAHLAHLAEHRDVYSFYDLYRQQDALESALYTPELSVGAARVLGLLGTLKAQRALVTLASQHARPLAERQAAAKGFEVAVDHHGLLLTRDEILLQFDRYNQSEALDRGTQQVLGSILDSIELPRKKKSQQEGQDAAAS
jgi:hypothetical protein